MNKLESPTASGAAHGWAPWQPPFRYNFDGQWIEDCRGRRMLDVRGWGYLTGKGSESLGMDEDEAERIQDAMGKRTADLMNSEVKVPNAEVSDGGPLTPKSTETRTRRSQH